MQKRMSRASKKIAVEFSSNYVDMYRQLQPGKASANSLEALFKARTKGGRPAVVVLFSQT